MSKKAHKSIDINPGKETDQEEINEVIKDYYLMKPTYYMIEFQVGKFTEVYICRGKIDGNNKVCEKKCEKKICELCPGNTLFGTEKEYKIYKPEEYDRKTAFIKPAYREMLRNPKKIFRVFKGDNVKYELLRKLLQSEYFIKSDALDKDFVLNGDYNSVATMAIKNKPIVFATFDKVNPLKLELLRQVNISTDIFDQQEHRKDLVMNGQLNQDRARALDSNYVRHFFTTVHKYVQNKKVMRNGNLIKVDKCLCDTWKEKVAFQCCTTSDSFPSSSMLLHVVNEFEYEMTNLVFEKSKLIEKNKIVKEYMKQVEAELKQRTIPGYVPKDIKSDDKIKTEF